MNNLKKKGTILIVSSVVAALFIGCGSGSSTPTFDYKGKAIDDYVKNAPIVTSEGRAISCGKTNEKGQFECPVIAQNYPLKMDCSNPKANECIDIATGKQFKGTFLAPAGSKVITPITTLVKIAKDKLGDLKKAEKVVKETLGLPEKIEITKVDPIEANNNTLLSVQAKVATVLKLASTATNTSTEKIAEAIVEEAVKSKTTDLEEIADNIIDDNEVKDTLETILDSIPTTLDRVTAGAIELIVDKAIEENKTDDLASNLSSQLDDAKAKVVSNLEDQNQTIQPQPNKPEQPATGATGASGNSEE